MSAIDKLDEDIDTQIKKAEPLRHAILRTALSGGLLPQNLADEPASILVERIQADRNGKSSKKNRKVGT